jgi:Na+/citrate or Na+/malate symporter
MGFPLSTARFVSVFLAMAVAMSLNGIGRELLLKRFLSEHVAGVVSAVLGVILIGVITQVGFRPLSFTATTTLQLAAVSVALVVCTIAFESVLGRYIDHKSWSALLAHYAVWRGDLWLIVLAWLALTPFVWSARG